MLVHFRILQERLLLTFVVPWKAHKSNSPWARVLITTWNTLWLTLRRRLSKNLWITAFYFILLLSHVRPKMWFGLNWPLILKWCGCAWIIVLPSKQNKTLLNKTCYGQIVPGKSVRKNFKNYFYEVSGIIL